MLSLVLMTALALPAMPGGALPAQDASPRTRGLSADAPVSVHPGPAQESASTAAAPQAWSLGTLEIGVLGGYATGTVYDPPRTSTGFAQVLGRLGFHFGATGSGRMRGNFAIVVEGVGIAIDQQPSAAGGGVNLLIRYTWVAGNWRPSLFAGAGVIFTDEEVPPGETKHNFSPQGGIGLAYMIAPAWSLGGEYRFHHLSNKGATETNPGINSHLVLFGVSWFR